MRFSIRWLLGVVAYLSLALAAAVTRSNLLMDLLWGVSLLAVCYAGLIACFARGQRQAMALGFVMLSVLHIVGMYLRPESVPVMQVFKSAGYMVDSSRIFERGPTGPPRYAAELAHIPRTANAVVTVASGLIGCLLGALAYKNCTKEKE